MKARLVFPTGRPFRFSKRLLLVAAGLIVLFGAGAALLLALLPAPHRPIHFMLAGTFGAVLEIAAFFVVVTFRVFDRTYLRFDLRRPMAASRWRRSRSKDC